MDKPNTNMRGSQRALKMLHAQMQQNQTGGVKKPNDGLGWPPKSSAASSSSNIGSLDQASTSAKPNSIFASFGDAAALLRQQEQLKRERAREPVPLVSTPVSNRVRHNYASPEASVPSNGGVTFHCDNSVGLLDLETSRLSSIAGNNSNMEFSNLGSVSQSQKEDCHPAPFSSNKPSSSSSSAGIAHFADDSDLQDAQETRSSMCFSLGDGKVTSIVATTDGAYCIAGFSSGAIRLFDLTNEGNMDAEDRFGYRIGFIESQRGSVQVHLELGSAMRGVGGCEVDCCHLFAGARQGSTTMLAIDIGSLREVHKKRGFITVAGGGVQVLAHSDARLKGMTALATISATSPPRVFSRSQPSQGGESQASLESESASRGYSATYKMITGRGFGAFHLWEVTLEARPVSGILGSPGASNSNSNSSVNGNANSASMSYTQKWVHLYQGGINGPTLSFAALVRSLLYAPPQAAGGDEHGTSSASLSLWGHCQQRMATSSTSITNVAADCAVATTQVLVSDTHKDLRLVGLAASPAPVMEASELADTTTLLPAPSGSAGANTGASATMVSIGKPVPLKDSIGTYAASEDGCILFGGKYDLVVSFLDTSTAGSNNAHATPNFAFRAVFSLSDFVSGAVGRSTKKNSRHLREISEIWCTPDGAYALILCTDNAVLLYSVCDITSKSSYPTRTEGTAVYTTGAASVPGLNSGAGFLTYLFEAEDTVNLDLGISYAYTGSDRNVHHNAASRIVTFGHSAACSCDVHASRSVGPLAMPHRMHHLPPENVLISISWWLIENPMLGGVLRVCRLKLPASLTEQPVGPSSMRSAKHFQHIVPLCIATSALILDEKAPAPTSSNRSRRPTADCNCALCGYVSTKHWSDDDLLEAEKVLFMNIGSVSASGASLPGLQGVSSGHRSVESVAKTADKRDRERAPKKKEVHRRDSDPNMQLIAGSNPVEDSAGTTAPQDKKQKTAHPFTHSGSQLSEGTHEPPSHDTSFSGSSFEVDMEDHGAASEEETGFVDLTGEAEKDEDIAPTGNRKTTTTLSAVPRPTRTPSVAGAHLSTAAAVASEPSTAKELRQELERIRVENRRLKDDTDLTMRKADRRFEMEMAARRFWKQEKNKLEGTIAELQKQAQYLAAERDKVKRVHSLLQTVLDTASDSLQYTDDVLDATLQGRTARTALSVDSEGLQSPATRLQSELTEVAQTGVSSSSSNHKTRNSSSENRRSRSDGTSSGEVNFGRKPFFCIICMDHTARVAIQPCGHICFCPEHAQEIDRRRHDHNHSKCPLCQAKITSFLTLQGIDN